MSEISATNPRQSQAVATAATPSAAAEIFDQGYRSYDGPRLGVTAAARSVYKVSIQRALGLRRKFRYKIVPMITVGIAYVPAIIFVGLAALLGDFAEGLVVEYAGYFAMLSVVNLLFSAFVAPELMNSDRQNGMYGLYMASPLNQASYLLAKAAALMTVLVLVTSLPALLLLAGYLLTGLGPSGLSILTTVGKILLSGLVVSLYFSLVGMAISSTTKRQSFASAGIVLFFLVSSIVSGALLDLDNASPLLGLLALLQIPLDLVARIFNEPIEQISAVSTFSTLAVWLGICLVSLATIVFSYRRLEVTK